MGLTQPKATSTSLLPPLGSTQAPGSPVRSAPSGPLFSGASPKPGCRGRWEGLSGASFLDATPRPAAKTYHFLDLSLGGGLRGMRKRARMGCMSHRAGTQKRCRQPLLPGESLRGPFSPWPPVPPPPTALAGPALLSQTPHLRGAPSAISMAVIPKDQMSLCGDERRGTGDCPDHLANHQPSLLGTAFRPPPFPRPLCTNLHCPPHLPVLPPTLPWPRSFSTPHELHTLGPSSCSPTCWSP